MNFCHGCDGNIKYQDVTYDHQHMYVNLFGDTKTTWFVDGRAFTDSNLAIKYVIRTLDCTHVEAMRYLRLLQKLYN